MCRDSYPIKDIVINTASDLNIERSAWPFISVVVPLLIESLNVVLFPGLISNCLDTILAKGIGSNVC